MITIQKGTDKQIQFAEKIRSQKLTALLKEIKETREYWGEEYSDDLNEKEIKKIEFLQNCNDAAIIIQINDVFKGWKSVGL